MSKRRYAEGTSVDASTSIQQIKSILEDYGCTQIIERTMSDGLEMYFERDGVFYKTSLKFKAKDDPEFTNYYRGSVLYRYADSEIEKRWKQERNRKCRALFMIVKARVVSIEEEISTFEREFLPDVMARDGSTFADHAKEIHTQMKGLGAPNVLALGGR